eukprot:362110-Chlamydomonas_euryale.AAC.11
MPPCSGKQGSAGGRAADWLGGSHADVNGPSISSRLIRAHACMCRGAHGQACFSRHLQRVPRVHSPHPEASRRMILSSLRSVGRFASEK